MAGGNTPDLAALSATIDPAGQRAPAQARSGRPPATKGEKIMLDTTTGFGARAERRLREEIIIWLTTVGPDRTPQPSPVWFLWDGETFLIYSKPNTPKLRNIARNPRVALNLDGDGRGGNIVVITGEARVAPDAPPATAVPAYLAKYQEQIARNWKTPEGFAREYSEPIRVTPSKLRGH